VDAVRFTILGGSGFIGSHLTASLRSQGVSCDVPARGDEFISRPLGHVIYCVGLTADFRSRPFDTVEAHVWQLARLLREAEFDSFLYLSTTRIYLGAESSDEEAELRVNPTRLEDLYNLSKLMGESLCLNSGRTGVRIARLSNVFGRGPQGNNFLSSILRDAVQGKKVTLRTALESAKDYVGVEAVASVLPRITTSGRERIYNVAAGFNTTHGQLAETIEQLTGCQFNVAPGAKTVAFPTILVDRVREEFGFAPSSVLDSLGMLLSENKEMTL
jgi:nucleoside-diphosphate-sugar epimerase